MKVLSTLLVAAAGFSFAVHHYKPGDTLPIIAADSSQLADLKSSHQAWRKNSQQALEYKLERVQKQQEKNRILDNEVPRSVWFDQERERAISRLQGRPYDILVVPVQVDGHTFDATTRSLITLSIAQRLEQGTTLRVADPVLIAKALGSTSRTIPVEQVQALATRLDIPQAVVSYVGYEGEPTKSPAAFKFRSTLYSMTSSGRLEAIDKRQYVETGLPFNQEMLPYDVFVGLRDKVISALVGTDQEIAPNAPYVATRPELLLGSELSDFANAAEAGSLRPVFDLQLLGMLHAPDSSTRDRSHLFERSLVLLEQFDPRSDDYALLRSRALGHLNRRQAALKTLADASPDSDEEKMLWQFLHGNVVDKTLPNNGATNEIAALISLLENTRLKFAYSHQPDWSNLRLIAGALSEPWQYLVGEAAMDQFVWQDHTNAPIKHLMDLSFPVDEFSVRAVQTQINLNPQLDAEVVLSRALLSHTNRIETVDAPVSGLYAGVADLMDLMRNTTVENTRQRIRKYQSTLGKPKQALRMVEETEELFAGHPDMSLLAGTVSGDNQKKIDAVLWAGGRTVSNWYIADRFPTYNRVYGTIPQQRLDEISFSNDWPTGAYAFTDCLAGTISGHYCLVDAIDSALQSGDKNKADELLRANTDRFNGHPELLDFRFRAYRALGDVQGIASLQKLVENNQSSEWALIDRIATYHLESSRNEEALQVVLAYPGFHEPGHASGVALVNRLYDFGSRFWWAGAHEQARVLYRMVDQYSTGAGAELASRARLALLERDFDTAIRQNENRVSRYNDKFGLRDVIGLLAHTGEPGLAAGVLNNSMDRLVEPELWTAALILQRATNYSPDDIKEWLKTIELKSPLGKPHEFLGRHMFLSHTIDRVVPEALPQWIRDVHVGEVAYLTQHHVATHPGNKGFDYPRQRTFGVAAIDILPVLAAEALYAIEQGDFEKAYETFDTASYAHILGEFLPYYAFTAIKTGKTERINRYLSEYSNNQTGKPVVKDQQIGIYKDASFNARLAQAVIDAGSGDHAAAMILLKSVNAAVEHTEERLVFTRYQIIETARLLYVHSGVEQYKQFALDLARRNRVIEPIQPIQHLLLRC